MTATLWTLPNGLTALRVLAVPFLGLVLVAAGDSPGGRLAALALFLGASVTDAVDGWLARRWGQCTELGALVDPLADKALVGTALLCLSGLGLVPWWATVPILAREVAVTVLRLAVLPGGVIPASRGGKLKTVTQTVLIAVALAAPGWTEGVQVLAAGTVFWTVVTGVDYALKAAALTGSAPWLLAPGRTPGPVDRIGGGPTRLRDAAAQQGGAAGGSRVRS